MTFAELIREHHASPALERPEPVGEEPYAHIGYVDVDDRGRQVTDDPDVALCGYLFPPGCEMHDYDWDEKPICPACHEIDDMERAVYPDRFWRSA